MRESPCWFPKTGVLVGWFQGNHKETHHVAPPSLRHRHCVRPSQNRDSSLEGFVSLPIRKPTIWGGVPEFRRPESAIHPGLPSNIPVEWNEVSLGSLASNINATIPIASLIWSKVN